MAETKAPKLFHRNSIGYLQRQSARTHKPRHFRHFASQQLIIVWLEVRVLPAPPRSPAQTEIFQFSANSPEPAGIRAPILAPRWRHRQRGTHGDWFQVRVLSAPPCSLTQTEISQFHLRQAISESIAQAASRFVLSHCTVSLLNEPALGRIMIETRDLGSARHDWKGGYHDRQEHFG